MSDQEKITITTFSNFEDYLQTFGELTYRNKGCSMEPLLKEGRDLFTVKRKGPERCRPFDVILYRRGSTYVLHRIVKVRDHDYVVLGDNCLNKETGIRDEDILGIMTEFRRKGKLHSCEEPWYKFYSEAWCFLYPLRRGYKKTIIKIKNAVKKFMAIRRLNNGENL